MQDKMRPRDHLGMLQEAGFQIHIGQDTEDRSIASDYVAKNAVVDQDVTVVSRPLTDMTNGEIEQWIKIRYGQDMDCNMPLVAKDWEIGKRREPILALIKEDTITIDAFFFLMENRILPPQFTDEDVRWQPDLRGAKLMLKSPLQIARYAVREGMEHEIEEIKQAIEKFGNQRFKDGLADGL